jgi:hypothetical protein
MISVKIVHDRNGFVQYEDWFTNLSLAVSLEGWADTLKEHNIRFIGEYFVFDSDQDYTLFLLRWA